MQFGGEFLDRAQG